MLSWRAALALVSLLILLGVALLEFSSQHSASFRARKRGQVANDVQGELAAIRAFARDVMPDWRHQAHYESNLIKRDVCNDTFPGRYSQTCSPSRTLCCIIPGEELPACQQILGYGFCCTEHVDCFVDMASQCDQTGSIRCNSASCCPQYTTCYPGFNGTASLVRCNINRNLNPFATSSSTSSSATSTSSRSSTRTSSSATTTSSGSATSASASASNSASAGAQSSPDSSALPTGSKGLSGGTVAGIVIGALALLAIGIATGYFVFKRRSQRNSQLPQMVHPLPYTDQTYGTPPQQQQQQPPYGGQFIPASYHDAANKQRTLPLQELPDSRPPSELPS